MFLLSASVLFLDSLECLFQILDDIINVLGSNGKTDGIRLNALIQQLLFGALAVGCGCRMDNQRLYVCNICQQREDLQVVDEFLCLRSVALDLKGENGAAAVREVLLVQSLLLRILADRRMIYLFYLRMIVQILNNLQRILYVALYTQRQCFQTLQEEECVERRQCCAGITQQNRTDSGYKSGRSNCLCEADAMITWIRLSQLRELAGTNPVKFSAVYDNASNGRSVTADKLRCGMNNDICAILNRAYQIRRCECIVDY